MDLPAAFAKAQLEVKQLSDTPDSAALLQLYAWFKQASVGDARGERPGMTDFVARAKWDAWAALAGNSPAVAMQRYVDLVESLK